MEDADGVMYVQGKNTKNCQQLRERHGLDPPMKPQKEPPLLTLGFWVTSLHTGGETHAISLVPL